MMKHSEIFKTPHDYFYKFADLASATVQTEDSQHYFITADNEICKGFAEMIPYDYGSFAISISCYFFKGFSTFNNYQYNQSWLYGLILLDENESLLSLARFSAKPTNTVTKSGFELSELNTKEIRWKQGDNTSVNCIMFYISDEWLRNVLDFLPTPEMNDWKFLRDTIKQNLFFDMGKEHVITLLTAKIMPLLKVRDELAIQRRKSLVNELMHEVISLIFGNDPMPNDIQKDDLKRLILARNELVSNFRNPPLGLDELAKISGMNRHKFQKQFKEYFKKPFYQYYQEKRFAYAKQLIEENGYLVSQAAFAINYLHLGHFSSTFEKIYGIKPSDLKTRY